MKPSVFGFACLTFLGLTGYAQDIPHLSIRMRGALCFDTSPDNKYMAIAQGHTISLYSAGTDTKIKEFTGRDGKGGRPHSGDILAMRFDSKGEVLASCASDKSIKLWKVPSGELIGTLEGHEGAVVAVRFCENDQGLISASEDMTVRRWDLSALKQTWFKKAHTKPIRGLDVSPDGKWIATGGGDRQIVIYTLGDGSTVKVINAHDNWVRCLTFSPDSKMLASGGDDKVIRVWQTDGWQKVRELPQKGWIYDLAFSGDGRFLAAGLERNAAEVYDVKTGLPSLKIETGNPVQKITISPDGKTISTIEEFGTEIKEWDVGSLKILPVFRFKDEKDKMPPQIFVANPPNLINNRVTIYKDIIDLRGSVVDESGVRELKVNKVVTPVKENGNFIINLPLSVGDNFIEIEVTDVNDNIALKKFVIARKNLEGEAYNPAIAKNFLLVIGINNYQNWPKLNNAVKDASDVASVLISKYNFDFENVIVLKDEQATRSNIYNSMRSLIEKISSHDNLVIYYSGHGYFDALLNEGYWVPVDAKVKSEGDYVSNSEILKIINNINSQHTFLVADACFSGSLFSETTRGYTENVEKFKSRWGLASGRLEVVSDGGVGQNSPFARSFISYLRENDKDKFPVSDLIQFVKTKVAEVSNQTPLGNPLKNVGDEGGEFVFYRKN